MRRIALIATVVGMLWAASAEARVTIAAPNVVTTDDRVTVRGHAPRARSVVLQQRFGRRWAARARGRGGSYALSLRAPERRTVLTLRVLAIRRGRAVAVSRPRRVVVGAVEVLRPSGVVSAPAPGAAGTLRYAGRPPVARGEHVALDAGPETPHGLLARVVSKRVVGGQTVMETRPGSLFEALPEGRIAIGSAAAARARRAAGPEGFRAALACSGGPAGEVDGSLDVVLDPLLELDWSRGRVRSARAAATLTGDVELVARVAGRASCSLEETPVARWDAPPLRLSVGPIPVVIVPRAALHVSAEAEAGAAVEAGIAGTMSARAGLRYDGEAEPTGSFTHALTPIAPRTRVDASIGARVSPSVTFLMYGRAGPRFDLATGLQLDATAAADPWWTLSAPVVFSAGLRVPGLAGLEVAPRPVYSRTFPIGRAESEPGEDAPLRRASAAWDSPRTDVDLHVWDASGNHAWFRDKAAIPGALLSSDDTDGFGPEFFDETAVGGRAFTYGLCYFDDHGLGSTTVTVRMTDPDGSSRQSVHTLAATGESVILGASPAGSGFTPPGDWCRPRDGT